MHSPWLSSPWAPTAAAASRRPVITLRRDSLLCWTGSAQIAEELADVGDQDVRDLQSREVAALVEVGPAGDGVRRLAVAADRDVVSRGEHSRGDTGIRPRRP